jgi:hypothetical protein
MHRALHSYRYPHTKSASPILVLSFRHLDDSAIHGYTASLPLTDLPFEAYAAHSFPALTSSSPIWISQLCNHGCTAALKAKADTIAHRHITVLAGTRSLVARLRYLDLPPSRQQGPAISVRFHRSVNKYVLQLRAITSLQDVACMEIVAVSPTYSRHHAQPTLSPVRPPSLGASLITTNPCSSPSSILA